MWPSFFELQKLLSRRLCQINGLPNHSRPNHWLCVTRSEDLFQRISFLKFYVMGTAERHLFGIVHVKVDFFGVQKMLVTCMLGRFVWTTWLVQCDNHIFRSTGFLLCSKINTAVTGIPLCMLSRDISQRDTQCHVWLLLNNSCLAWRFFGPKAKIVIM